MLIKAFCLLSVQIIDSTKGVIPSVNEQMIVTAEDGQQIIVTNDSYQHHQTQPLIITPQRNSLGTGKGIRLMDLFSNFYAKNNLKVNQAK